MLEIKNLTVSVGGKTILQDFCLQIKKGETHVVMGPNGSGKSTLANVLSGNPLYEIISGEIVFNGKNLLERAPEERVHDGLFVSFQHPLEIPGVSNRRFLHASYNAIKKARNEEQLVLEDFEKLLNYKMANMQMDEKFKQRSLNEGFSGGEKKKNEILQMSLFEPKLSVLDEIDSGLDIDALQIVANRIKELHNKENSLLLITHYNRLLEYIKSNKVHILIKGKVVQSGNASLPLELEKKGYNWFLSNDT